MIARAIAILLLALCPSVLHAQITANKSPTPQVATALTYDLHEPIVLSCNVETTGDTDYKWSIPAPARLIDCGSTVYVWAPAGSYQVEVLVIDWEARKQATHRMEFRVGDAPAPEPDEPDEPDPQPTPAPVYPAPSTALQAAVAPVKVVAATDPATAAKLAEAFSDFADVLSTTPGTIDTTGKFSKAMQAFGKQLQLKIPGLAVALESAENAALGKEDVKLQPGQAGAFLKALAWALGGVQ